MRTAVPIVVVNISNHDDDIPARPIVGKYHLISEHEYRVQYSAQDTDSTSTAYTLTFDSHHSLLTGT